MSQSTDPRRAAHYNVEALLARKDAFDDMGYLEFFRNRSLNTGLYVLPAGAEDRQTPHDEDEIYYVLRGRGRLHLEGEHGAEQLPASAGDTLFVARGVVHRFVDVEEELHLLVFFASP